MLKLNTYLCNKYCAENIISINPINNALRYYYNIDFQIGTECKQIM